MTDQPETSSKHEFDISGQYEVQKDDEISEPGSVYLKTLNNNAQILNSTLKDNYRK